MFKARHRHHHGSGRRYDQMINSGLEKRYIRSETSSGAAAKLRACGRALSYRAEGGAA
jgi:hypothetical protein